MFIIKIAEENLDKIRETVDLPEATFHQFVRLYCNRTVPWYFVSGYISVSMRKFIYNIMPGYVTDQVFDYDIDKAKTDWAICVRKEVQE